MFRKSRPSFVITKDIHHIIEDHFFFVSLQRQINVLSLKLIAKKNFPHQFRNDFNHEFLLDL